MNRYFDWVEVYAKLALVQTLAQFSISITVFIVKIVFSPFFLFQRTQFASCKVNQ